MTIDRGLVGIMEVLKQLPQAELTGSIHREAQSNNSDFCLRQN